MTHPAADTITALRRKLRVARADGKNERRIADELAHENAKLKREVEALLFGLWKLAAAPEELRALVAKEARASDAIHCRVVDLERRLARVREALNSGAPDQAVLGLVSAAVRVEGTVKPVRSASVARSDVEGIVGENDAERL